MSTVLVLGKGGREHAIVRELAKTSEVGRILAYPGNYGTAREPKTTNLKIIDLQDPPTVDMVIVGSENYLADGIADRCAEKKIPCFGPVKACAKIETSKMYAKEIMTELGIPTARYTVVIQGSRPDVFLETLDKPPVIKRNGICGGKGVFLPKTKADALEFLSTRFLDESLIVEERLYGPEVSVMCYTDGTFVSVMPPVKDYKRLLDDDKGPNTGSMGSYCSEDLLTEQQINEVEGYLQKVVDYFREEGTPYVGVLYAGIMITENGIRVLEFNARFGDSEAQVVLPMTSNPFKIMMACVNGTLSDIPWCMYFSDSAIIVNVATRGYPDNPEIGLPVEIKEYNWGDSWIIYAGMDEEGKTCGGRVLGCVGMSISGTLSRKEAYDRLERVSFEGMQYRTDIAKEYKPVRVIVMGSTNGTDLEYIYHQIENDGFRAEIVAVVSNKPDAGILDKGKAHGTPTAVVTEENPLECVFYEYDFDLIVLIGYMKILPKEFVKRYENRIINVHPSLLPAFAGGMDKSVHQAVLDAGVKVTGCTVHIVTEKVDAGKILVQLSYDIQEDETVDSLKEKIQWLEGGALCEAIEMYRGGDTQAWQGQAYPYVKEDDNKRKYPVNIDAGNEVVKRIRTAVESTYTKDVCSPWGAFAGCYSLMSYWDGLVKNSCTHWGDFMPADTLVSSTDSVGSKILLAKKHGKLHTIGFDLVNHCINDIMVMGAKPLFMLDYVASAKLDPEEMVQIVEGVAAACKKEGVVLLGGETAEIQEMFKPGAIDLVGMIVGIIDNSRDIYQPITGKDIKAGDVVFGIPSSGFHTNGYTLINQHATAEDVEKYKLLEPHRCYAFDLKYYTHGGVHGLIHITGGGWFDNAARIVPGDLTIEIDIDDQTTPEPNGKYPYKVPDAFRWIQKKANVSETEMYRTFNMGIGMMVIVSAERAPLYQFPWIRLGDVKKRSDAFNPFNALTILTK